MNETNTPSTIFISSTKKVSLVPNQVSSGTCLSSSIFRISSQSRTSSLPHTSTCCRPATSPKRPSLHFDCQHRRYIVCVSGRRKINPLHTSRAICPNPLCYPRHACVFPGRRTASKYLPHLLINENPVSSIPVS